MLRCSLRVCLPIVLVIGVLGGCTQPHRYTVPIRWQTIEPEHVGTAPARLPEVLDYTRLPDATIHFPDERTPADSSAFPHRCIGQLLIYYTDGTVGQSTAFLVAPAHILTVADGFVGLAGARANACCRC